MQTLPEVSAAARRLHEGATIVDGLVFMSDGDPQGLRRANIAAINVTVSHMEAGFEDTCDEIAVWLERLRAPGSGWKLVDRVADVHAARVEGKVGLIMGWQNMRVIEDKLHRIPMFRRLGVSVMQLTYNNRNFIGDGCLEPEDSGLSLLGRRVVTAMNEAGVAIDLSHVGERTAMQAAERSRCPVLLTHANARSVVAMPRNKSDDLMKAVAATGGTVGASIYGPMCWDRDPAHQPSLADFMRHLEHIVSVVGVEHVSIGTDLPAVRDLRSVDSILEMTRTRFPENVGAYEQAFGGGARERYLRECGSHADLVRVTAALLDRGWSEPQIGAVLSGNLLRALDRCWSV